MALDRVTELEMEVEDLQAALQEKQDRVDELETMLQNEKWAVESDDALLQRVYNKLQQTVADADKALDHWDVVKDEMDQAAIDRAGEACDQLDYILPCLVDDLHEVLNDMEG